MALRRSLFPQLFLGLSLVLTVLVLGACAKKEAAKKAEAEVKTEGEKSEGENEGGRPLLTAAGSLLYFKGGVGGDTSIAATPQAHTGGGPTASTGDQVAWVLYGSGLYSHLSHFSRDDHLRDVQRSRGLDSVRGA